MIALVVAQLYTFVTSSAVFAEPEPNLNPEKIVIDTDIGDDIDDAFAVALALRSPEMKILGISTAFGDTAARATIVDRLLGETGHEQIPVAVGVPTPTPVGLYFSMSQKHYGADSRFARSTHPKSIDFILEQIRRYPGQVTLVTIGPLSNVGHLIDRDIATFRKLKRVVMMGGAVNAIKPDFGSAPATEPAPEWNILNDIPSAKRLFNSGVPIYMMPRDSTAHLAMDEVKRSEVFSEGTALTDSLATLYQLWNLSRSTPTPVLYDAMTVAYIADPQLCPTTPLHITVDDQGLTRRSDGPPNTYVCLHSNADAFFSFFLTRVIGTQQDGAAALARR